MNSLLSPEREDAVAFVPHVTRRALDGNSGIYGPGHRERPVIVPGRERSMGRRGKDRAGPVERAQGVVGQRRDDSRSAGLLLVNRVKRHVRRLVARPEGLKPIEQQLVVNSEGRRASVVAVELKGVVADPHQPEETW